MHIQNVIVIERCTNSFSLIPVYLNFDLFLVLPIHSDIIIFLECVNEMIQALFNVFDSKVIYNEHVLNRAVFVFSEARYESTLKLSLFV